MNGQVPGLPEDNDVIGIPPIAVEMPIGKSEDLAHRVQEGVEEQVEKCQPYQVIRKLEARKYFGTFSRFFLIVYSQLILTASPVLLTSPCSKNMAFIHNSVDIFKNHYRILRKMESAS